MLPEFTWPAVLVGAVLGIVFGASSLYLVMKVGMTVSASIPVAVLAITLFRALLAHVSASAGRRILENNIVQTTGSAGESIAFGVGVTMPAVMILGFEMEWLRVMVVSVLGRTAGHLDDDPAPPGVLRQAARHAEVSRRHRLRRRAGDRRDGRGHRQDGFRRASASRSSTSSSMGGLKLWRDVVAQPLSWFKGATPALEANPALLGVGYIIGTRVSCIMVAGGVLAWFVLMSDDRVLRRRTERSLAPARPAIR